MPEGDKVLALIRSLSPAEKRYFRRLTAQHGREAPHYWQLFHFLDQWTGEQPPDDEHWPAWPFLAHLPVVKHQLYERLLHALHLYQLDNQPEEVAKRYLHQGFILLRRGQITAARQRSRKARRWIEDQSAWTYWPELMLLERQLLEYQLRDDDQSAALQQWERDYDMGLEKLGNALRHAANKIRIAQRHLKNVSLPETDRSQLEEAWRQLPPPTSPEAAADHHQSAALLAFMARHPTEARAANRALLAELGKQDPARHGVAERYLATMYNLLIDELQLGEYEALQAGLAQLRVLPRQAGFKRLPRIQARIFQWSHQLELNSLVQQGLYEQAYAQLPAVARGLKAFATQLSRPAQASLRHLAGLVALQCGHTDDALSFLTPLYQESRPKVAHEIFHYAQFLHLLAHYAAGHLELVDHLTLNLRRQLGGQLEAEEDRLLRLLRQLLQAATKKARRERWEEYISSLPPANHRLSLYLDLPHLAPRLAAGSNM